MTVQVRRQSDPKCQHQRITERLAPILPERHSRGASHDGIKQISERARRVTVRCAGCPIRRLQCQGRCHGFQIENIEARLLEHGQTRAMREQLRKSNALLSRHAEFRPDRNNRRLQSDARFLQRV